MRSSDCEDEEIAAILRARTLTLGEVPSTPEAPTADVPLDDSQAPEFSPYWGPVDEINFTGMEPEPSTSHGLAMPASFQAAADAVDDGDGTLAASLAASCLPSTSQPPSVTQDGYMVNSPVAPAEKCSTVAGPAAKTPAVTLFDKYQAQTTAVQPAAAPPVANPAPLPGPRAAGPAADLAAPAAPKALLVESPARTVTDQGTPVSNTSPPDSTASSGGLQAGELELAEQLNLDYEDMVHMYPIIVKARPCFPAGA